MAKIEKAYSSVVVTDVSGSLIKSVDVMYYLSTSNSSLSGGNWTTEPPAWVDGKYYWQKTVTTYYNDETSETEPVCISGTKGETGDTGHGIASITEEYYLSTSKIEQTGGEWTTTPPTWESGKYIWTRSAIVWSNPTSITYTTPVCDSSWEAANDVKDELEGQITLINTSISSVTSRVDAVEKEIELKVEQTDITNAIDEYDKTISEGLRTRVSQIEVDIDGITSEVSDTQTLIEKIDTKVDNLQPTGLGWKVNYSNFATQSNGQIYLHGYDSETGESADVDGWVIWNGIKVVVPKATINPGTVCPSDTPIYVVRTTMTVGSRNQGSYLVWADFEASLSTTTVSDDGKGNVALSSPSLSNVTDDGEGNVAITNSDGSWKYSVLSPTEISGDWEWNHSSDIILGSFYHAGNGKPIESAQIYTTAVSCDSVITSIETKTIIDQTKDTILLQASETYATKGELSVTDKKVAEIKITADEVSTEVANARGDSSSLKVRIDGIESNVVDVENNLSSTIAQTAGEIRSEVKSGDDALSSQISQTKEELNATITNTEKNLQTQITANTDEIKLKASTEDMEAAIKESADNITLSVSEKLSDSRDFMGVRYIRDWLNGSAKILNEPDEGVETVEIIDTESTESTETIVESDISNKWVECMVLVGEKDIAAGIIPTCYDENLQEIPIENLNPGVYTDEMLLDIYEEDANVSDDVETVDVISDIETTEEETENANTTPIPLEEQYIELNGKHCLQIDLGSVHYDIDSISIWHYYVDGDHYNHLLEVSVDGENWNVLFDSDLAGSYAETEDGRIYHFSNYAIDKTLSQLRIEQDNITLRVQDNASHFAELSVTTGGICSTVGNIQEKQSELSSDIDKISGEIKDVTEDLKNNYTTLTQTEEKINAAVSNVDGKITAAVELSESGWKGKFAILGMMEEDKELQDATDTYIHMDWTGITVTGETSPDQSEEDKNKVISTHMTRYGFFGRNMEGEDVFWLDAQGCHTGRAYIDNGWETPGIKMIPIEYDNNGNSVNGVVYVKSGGAS